MWCWCVGLMCTCCVLSLRTHKKPLMDGQVPGTIAVINIKYGSTHQAIAFKHCCPSASGRDACSCSNFVFDMWVFLWRVCISCGAHSSPVESAIAHSGSGEVFWGGNFECARAVFRQKPDKQIRQLIGRVWRCRSIWGARVWAGIIGQYNTLLTTPQRE